MKRLKAIWLILNADRYFIFTESEDFNKAGMAVDNYTSAELKGAILTLAESICNEAIMDNVLNNAKGLINKK